LEDSPGFLRKRVWRMRTEISITVSAADRKRLQAHVKDSMLLKSNHPTRAAFRIVGDSWEAVTNTRNSFAEQGSEEGGCLLLIADRRSAPRSKFARPAPRTNSIFSAHGQAMLGSQPIKSAKESEAKPNSSILSSNGFRLNH
jgi:hypothetical protein